MNTKTLLILGGAAVVGFLLFSKKSVGPMGPRWKLARPSGAMSLRYDRRDVRPPAVDARSSYRRRDDKNPVFE